ncbi:MAG: S1 RNA-binding domain-containing protein, partial [Planctomycetaceae bacterium]|nr:S1 RNA-binding domain-containing protein [Planctomycetaceae bacterium]
MVNRNLIHKLDIDEQDWDSQLEEAMGGTPAEDMDWGGEEVVANKIVVGKIVRIENEHVIVDVGYKSEGPIPISEWEDGDEPPKVGDEIKVLI